jgi:hypothetical protein
MQVQLITNAEAEGVLLQLANEATRMHWAVAWATGNAVSAAARAHSRHLDCLVIGTHFYQTDPELLEKLQDIPSVKVRPPVGPLFHPKLYCFETEERAWALVGSHNLTQSAMGGSNTEASVLLTGSPNDSVFKTLKAFIRQEWKRGQNIDRDFLFSYREQYMAKRPAKEALQRFIPAKPPRNRQRPPTHLSWPEFLAEVRNDRGLEERLHVLRAARDLFARYPSFAKMGDTDRKGVAGTIGRTQKVTGGPDWAWFGTMRSSGSFASLVKNKPGGLSRALDHITDDSEVTHDAYKRFCREFVAAFQGQERQGGVATATRLLALKRPDIFVAVNNENRRGLCDALGVAPTTLSLENYWERVVLRLQDAPFWLSPRPRAPEAAAIWDSRAALLDSIYYEGLGPTGAT